MASENVGMFLQEEEGILGGRDWGGLVQGHTHTGQSQQGATTFSSLADSKAKISVGGG